MDFSNAKIDKLIIHQVGNKLREEGIYFSKSPQKLEDKLEKKLLNYLLKSFNYETDIYCFSHSSSLKYNEVYSYSNNIFSFKNFQTETEKITQHLYENSTHPKIVLGELLIVYFKHIKYEDILTDAIGIYKIEKKDLFLKVLRGDHTLTFEPNEGISTNKIEKGCLIFNINDKDGYRALNIDIHQKITDYWVNKFLGIKLFENDTYKTKQFFNLYKNFSDEILSTKYETSEQVKFSNNFIDYFESKDIYSYDDFLESAITNDEIKNDFIDYQLSHQDNFPIDLSQEFSISKDDVKKEKRKIKNIIKLDTNIEVKFLHDHVHETLDFEKGYDEKKSMHYYKFFYNEEN